MSNSYLYNRFNLEVELILALNVIHEYPSSSHLQGTQDGKGPFRCNLCFCTGKNVFYRSKQRYLSHLKRHPQGISSAPFKVLHLF